MMKMLEAPKAQQTQAEKEKTNYQKKSTTEESETETGKKHAEPIISFSLLLSILAALAIGLIYWGTRSADFTFSTSWIPSVNMNFSWLTWIIVIVLILLAYFRKELRRFRIFPKVDGELFRYIFFGFLLVCAMSYIVSMFFKNKKMPGDAEPLVQTTVSSTTAPNPPRVAIPLKSGVNHLKAGTEYYYFRDGRKFDVYLTADTSVTLKYHKEQDTTAKWQVLNERRDGVPYVYFSGEPPLDYVGRVIVTADKTIDVIIKRPKNEL